MFHKYLSKMYEIPSYIYFIAIFASIIAWAFLDKCYNKKRFWGILNRVIFFLSLVAIFTITILVRDVQECGVYLNPLQVFELAKDFPDVYNQMVLNVVLFLPLGLTLPLAFEIKKPEVTAISVALLYSLFIEFLQFKLQRGFFDTADLILNVMGATLGVLAYIVSNRLLKSFSR